jgi:hypothetical protein
MRPPVPGSNPAILGGTFAARNINDEYGYINAPPSMVSHHQKYPEILPTPPENKQFLSFQEIISNKN